MGCFFYKSKNIHIESITIEDCGAKFGIHNQWTNFTGMSALMFYDSCDIEVVKISMNRNLEYAMLAQQVFGNFTISYSAFLNCVVTPRNKYSNIGSNARIFLYIQSPIGHGN